MAPNYAEEARNPKKMMAYATYISCIGLAVVYTFWAWMLVTSYGGVQGPVAVGRRGPVRHQDACPGQRRAAGGQLRQRLLPGRAEVRAASWLKDLFEIFIITGSFACSLAFWNTANRYLFSMGREGILPRVARADALHATRARSWRRCVTLFFVIVFTLLFATGIVGGAQRTALGIGVSDPLVALSQIGTWLPFQGNLLLFPIMALCSIAIMVYFLTRRRDGFHWFKTLLAPILGAASIVFAVYLMITNRAALTRDAEHRLDVRRRRSSRSVCSSPGCCSVSVYSRWSRAPLRRRRQVRPRRGLRPAPEVQMGAAVDASPRCRRADASCDSGQVASASACRSSPPSLTR